MISAGQFSRDVWAFNVSSRPLERFLNFFTRKNVINMYNYYQCLANCIILNFLDVHV